jgi:3-phosphoinositide dependent protein kinase-1
MSSEEWQERGAAVSLRQEIDPSGRTISRYVKKGVRDFSFGRTLGEGSYSTVIAATDRQTLKEYAIKILDKRHIIKEKKVKYVNIEKDTLNRLTDHPGVVRLYYTFQDERSLYFVLDLASGGELLGVLKRMTSFDEECTRFYGAQILDTIDYMHKRGVIHRDLKPENVLLDSHMHVKITDFGTAKILDSTRRMDDGGNGIPHMGSPESNQDRASSFVGTAEYVSPELLTDKNACKASDLWAFGCIIYQLLSGRPPFKGGNEYQTFQKIVALDYEFPMGFPPVARDLVERLLVLDPASRLQIEHVKNHEFFDGITWGRGLWKQKAPRLKPYAPPPPEPIKLNGGSNGDSFPPNINKSSHLAAQNIVGSSRPYPRIITDLPPPSQLDIEWSPVLTSSNERILKMGNLTVSAAPLPGGGHSRGGNGDHEGPKLLSRFFGGATTKKRPRLVLVTTCGRVVVVPAGGDDKRPKLDIPLLSPDVQYRSTTDMKGHSSFIIDTVSRDYFLDAAVV